MESVSWGGGEVRWLGTRLRNPPVCNFTYKLVFFAWPVDTSGERGGGGYLSRHTCHAKPVAICGQSLLGVQEKKKKNKKRRRRFARRTTMPFVPSGREQRLVLYRSFRFSFGACVPSKKTLLLLFLASSVCTRTHARTAVEFVRFTIHVPLPSPSPPPPSLSVVPCVFSWVVGPR